MKITIEQLQAMSDSELIQYVIKNKLTTKEMTFQYLSKEETKIEEEITYTFEQIKKHIQYNNKEGILYLPFINEKENPILRKKVFSQKKYDRIPKWGHFNVLRAAVVNEIFGLVTATMLIEQVSRKVDIQFENEKNGDKPKVEYSMFMYEEEEFIQIDMENKEDPHTQEYLRRMEMKEYVFKRCKKFVYAYYESLDDMLDLKAPNVNKQVLHDFFTKWYEFLGYGMPLGVSTSLIFGQISVDEYNTFLDVMDYYTEEIPKILSVLPTLPGGSEVTSPDYLLYMENPANYLMDLFKFREGKESHSGYFIWKGRAYPTLAEVERRTYLTDYSSTIFKEEEWAQESIAKKEGR
ncbi:MULTISPECIES: hypothetical protein [unclassified Bacillus cereus group]|uniref:hypothetical protein n=1 Tax=unclassified Bacillus cereus group TaxID=2750818 RepID=UPI0029C4502C|nr:MULTISPECIES: hypothetical protein [unclassified Bacillus cereus group]MDX5880813.1 hypothetical protein [Bacillus cereus group sp. BfR-BA-01042]MDX5906671.1 hypothetical protein [Bacillus cereus group sp. BfR-BA-01048]